MNNLLELRRYTSESQIAEEPNPFPNPRTNRNHSRFRSLVTSPGIPVGSARLRQTEFGIKPPKIAGGTVRVKDEIRLDFDIQRAR